MHKLAFILHAIKVSGFWQMLDGMRSLLQYQTELFHCLKNPLLFLFILLHWMQDNHWFFFLLPLFVLPFPQCHIIGVRKYKAFSDCFLLLRMNLSFFHVFLWLESSFLFSQKNIPFYGYFHSLFICSPIGGHFGSFYFCKYE